MSGCTAGASSPIAGSRPWTSARWRRACATSREAGRCETRVTVVLDAGPIALEDVRAVACDGAAVSVGPEAARRVAESRRYVDELTGTSAPIYGITTGVGKLKDVVIPREHRDELQRNLVLSHAGGVGAPLSESETRAVMV